MLHLVVNKMPEAWQKLAFVNKHERDNEITFYEPTHTYTIKGSSKGIISGTGFLHAFFHHFDAKAVIKQMMSKANWPQNKWYKKGITIDELANQWTESGKDASGKGTALHLAIEQFLNGSAELIPQEVLDSIEWSYFLKFWKKYGDDLEPYRTEWEVWSEQHLLCGSIDMVFKRKSDGKFLIYDWKRSKEIKMKSFGKQKGLAPLDHLDDCNYWHYTLQLNVYRWILETFYGLEVADLYLVVLHPDNDTYLRVKLNRLEEEVEDMLECRLRALKAGSSQPVLLPIPEETHEKPVTQVNDDYAFLD